GLPPRSSRRPGGDCGSSRSGAPRSDPRPRNEHFAGEPAGRMIEFAGGILEPTRWRSFENLVALASIPSSNGLARDVTGVYVQEEQWLPGPLFVAEAQPAASGA